MHTATLSAPNPAAGHRQPMPLPETPGHSHTILSNQCKETEETNRWERREISSRKLEISREHFMGSIKGRNSMDLTEAEDINKKW